MSIRHYSSDFDELDESTLQLLASRYCKVAAPRERHELPRHHRGVEHHDDVRTMRKSHRPRAPRFRDFAE